MSVDASQTEFFCLCQCGTAECNAGTICAQCECCPACCECDEFDDGNPED